MRTNLIQTYMNNRPSTDKNNRNLDINYVLSNRTFIKPLPPEGHLVQNGLLDMPANAARDLAYDFNSLKHSSKGKANDHELGKINDIGMKFGGLAIAGYLMTRKQTPLTKAMELVGLVSFFGAMTLWPKIALQLPAKLVHGFNIRQEYEDSFGRRKMFFQDPQYIPWDMVSDEKINKIGNHMRVPQDIPNRRDFIQEKMKKTAVQNNTLWMLTAGFATPITSALICNACEKPLNKFLGERRSQKADSLIRGFDNVWEKYKDKSYLNGLEKLYSENAGKELTQELVNEINRTLTQGFDGVTASAIKTDLHNIMELGDKKYIIDNNVVQRLIENITKTLESILSKEQISAIVPNSEVLTGLVTDKDGKSLFGANLSEFEVQKVTEKIGKQLKDNIKEYNENSGTSVSPRNIKLVMQRLFNQKNGKGPVSAALYSVCRTVLDEGKIESLRKIAESLADFRAKNAVLDEYIYLKAGAAPETVVANAWNEVTSKLPKLLNITDKEITSVRHDPKLSGELLREKLEQIASDKTEYERVMTKLNEMLSDLAGKTDYNRVQNSMKQYSSCVEDVFESSASNMSSNNMHNTAKRLVGTLDKDVCGSLKNVQLQYAENRLLGVKSSLYRLLNTLDFYRRIATKENIPALHSKMPLEVKEEIVEFCKKLSLEGSTSDFWTKFYDLRNPNPDLTDCGQIEVQAGKVINKYLGKTVPGGKVDLPNDKAFFQEVMKLLYENDIHPDTGAGLSGILDDFKQYRADFKNEVGNIDYFAKPYHRLGDGQAAANKIFLRIGMSPEQMLHSTIKEKFNTKQWLKTFGGIGAALLGVTILAQFFFGKFKKPERTKHD